ncbi:MAG TPA: tetratricopeptide repeat protein [Chloroflexia bacterium]|nr:tetratricopeptide repeat protein [Chloroflexia bacterium]
MLETIHEYAREILQQGGEAPAPRQGHAQYFLRLVEQVERELLGPRHLAWMNRLEDEHDNIRAALRWALDTGAVEVALRLAGALWLFWWTHVHYREGRQWLEEALAQAQRGNEHPVAVPPKVYAKALNALGLMVQPLGEFALAEKLFTESLAIFEQAGDRWWTAEVLQNLGVLVGNLGQIARGQQLCEQSLAIWREVGEPFWGMGRALHNLAALAMERGDYEQAEHLFEESLALGADSGKHIQNLRNIQHLARLRLRQRDYARCASLLQDALTQAQELGHKETTVECLRDWAELLAASGQIERAARLFGAVDAIYAANGLVEPPLDQTPSDEVRAALRAQVGEAVWHQAWQEGRTMTLDAAITYAFDKDPTPD